MACSRLSRKSIFVPSGVVIKCLENIVSIEGSFGLKKINLPSGISIDLSDGSCKVNANDSVKISIIGTFYANLKRAINDASNPTVVTVDLKGVGFKAFMAKGNFLVLNLGFSHLIALDCPSDVKIAIRDSNKIDVTGFWDDVSLFVDDLKRTKPWDPCRQDGVVISGSFLRKKVGKKK